MEENIVTYEQAIQFAKEWKQPKPLDNCNCAVCEEERKKEYSK